MTRPELAIVIVTYQSADVIEECLAAAESTGAEIVVIDNASADGTQALVANRAVGSTQIRLIANPENRGFAAAVNQGVRATTAPFVLLLNPDAVLQGPVDSLIRACREPGVGAVGGKLIDAYGVPQIGFNVRRFPTPAAFISENMFINRLWPGNPVNWRFRCFDIDLNRADEIDQPAGAFMMFPRRVWGQMQGFDEGFFPLWFEDVDFCKRIRNAGMRILYQPDSVARHKGGHSLSSIGLGTKTEYWYVGLLRYSIKHFTLGGKILTCLSVIAGSAPRLLAGAPGNPFRDLYRVYIRVARLAFRSVWKSKVELGEVLFLSPAMRKNSVSNDAK
jgi:N-acetylglucosaminyl-diphospho-decaprenol L-rhamnosyltransferase